MTNSNPTSLPVPAFAGGTQAITLTPVVGTPRRDTPDVHPGRRERSKTASSA